MCSCSKCFPLMFCSFEEDGVRCVDSIRFALNGTRRTREATHPTDDTTYTRLDSIRLNSSGWFVSLTRECVLVVVVGVVGIDVLVLAWYESGVLFDGAKGFSLSNLERRTFQKKAKAKSTNPKKPSPNPPTQCRGSEKLNKYLYHD